jgi:tetratricopeptide (TPR) repeat protein
MVRRALLATALVSALSSTVPAQHVADEHSRREAIRHYQVGQELMGGERFERAAEEFSKAIQLDPLFTLAHYFLGQAYVNLQRFPSAIKAYKECIESCRAIYSLRQTNRFEAERRRDDELRALRETVAVARAQATRSPGSGLGLRATQLEQQMQNLERDRASIDGPFQPPAEVLLALGSALFHNNQVEQAEFEWLAAIQVNSRMGEAHNNLAVLYMRTGRLQAAAEEMKLAERNGVRVNPQFKKDLKQAMASRP